MGRKKKEINLEHVQAEVVQEGFGDTIAKITKFFGIEPCEPCNKRKEFLNKKYPYLVPKEDITEEEYNFIVSINEKNKITNDEIEKLFITYNKLFGRKVKKCMCPSVIKRMLEDITKIYINNEN